MKKLLTSLMCVMMVICFMPGMAFAADTDTITKVTTKEQLVTAVENGGTIQLENDVTLDSVLNIQQDTVLDLGGYSLNRNGQVITTKNATVEIKNGTVTTGTAWAAAIQVLSGSKLTIAADATVQGGYTIGIVSPKGQDNTAEGKGTVIDIYGTLIGMDTDHQYGSGGVSVNGTVKDMTGYATIHIHSGASITAKKGTSSNINDADAPAIYAAGYAEWIIDKGAAISGDEALSIKSGKFTINGGSFEAYGDHFDPATAYGNGSEATGAAISITNNNNYAKNVEVVVNGGEFYSEQGYAFYESDTATHQGNAVKKLEIKDGSFWSAYGPIYSKHMQNFITGGYFDFEPSEYIAEGCISVPSDNAEYNSMVIEKTSGECVEPAVGVPETIVDDSFGNEIKKIAGSVEVDKLNQIAALESQKITANKAEALLKNTTLKPAEGKELTLYVQTYLKVAAKSYDKDAKILTFDIKPMMQIVASTADTADDISLDGDAPNAEIIQDAKEIEVDTSVWMTINLPEKFFTEGEPLYVKHVKDGKTYYYEGSIGADDNGNYVSFRNPHGFSEFTVTKTGPAAMIDEVGYKTLQEAVDNVKDGEVIEVTADNDEDVVVNKETSFSLYVDEAIDFSGSISAGKGYKLSIVKEDGNDVYKVTKDTTSTGGGTIIVAPGAQKPVITGENAKITLSDDGTMATIKVADGYELVDVTVNGVSKGKVDTLTGLKTGDKVVVTTKKIDTTEDEIAAVKATKLVARSANAKAPSGKKAIKVYWFNKDGSELNFDGYEIYRSTKKNSFGKKPIYTAKKTQYFNTSAKKGTRYYYKVRGYKVIGGEKVYTDFSLKAIRTAK